MREESEEYLVKEPEELDNRLIGEAALFRTSQPLNELGPWSVYEADEPEIVELTTARFVYTVCRFESEVEMYTGFHPRAGIATVTVADDPVPLPTTDQSRALIATQLHDEHPVGKVAVARSPLVLFV